MLAKIIDGKALAKSILDNCAQRTQALIARGITPCLTVIRVGEDPASVIYVNGKIADCAHAGIRSSLIALPADTQKKVLLDTIEQCNQAPYIHGILVQLPLPQHLDEDGVINAIAPHKDADGFHPINAGRLFQGNLQTAVVACTPAGIMNMLAMTGVPLAGKHAVVVGRSNIVGKPISMLLLSAHCTVTICHSRTTHLAEEISRADIVVAAVGKSEMVRGEWIKPGAIVIDVGMNRNAQGKLTGDVEFTVARTRASWISPVPGGVGPMTRAMLLANTLTLAERGFAH